MIFHESINLEYDFGFDDFETFDYSVYNLSAWREHIKENPETLLNITKLLWESEYNSENWKEDTLNDFDVSSFDFVSQDEDNVAVISALFDYFDDYDIEEEMKIDSEIEDSIKDFYEKDALEEYKTQEEPLSELEQSEYYRNVERGM